MQRTSAKSRVTTSIYRSLTTHGLFGYARVREIYPISVTGETRPVLPANARFRGAALACIPRLSPRALHRPALLCRLKIRVLCAVTAFCCLSVVCIIPLRFKLSMYALHDLFRALALCSRRFTQFSAFCGENGKNLYSPAYLSGAHRCVADEWAGFGRFLAVCGGCAGGFDVIEYRCYEK